MKKVDQLIEEVVSGKDAKIAIESYLNENNYDTIAQDLIKHLGVSANPSAIKKAVQNYGLRGNNSELDVILKALNLPSNKKMVVGQFINSHSLNESG